MSVAGTERRRQLVTAGLGTALTLVMGTVLIVGFRLATHMRADITALQAASTLQTYPEEISHQLNSLRDRLEVRAYAGQALADLQASVKRFDQELKQINAAGDMDSPQLGRALLLWHQYAPVLDPVIEFTGQPYVDSDSGGSALSREGREHYAQVKRAQLFASDNARPLQAQLSSLAATLQHTSSAPPRLRTLLAAGCCAVRRRGPVSRSRARRRAMRKNNPRHPGVRQGFFLLDANYRIGSVWSDALRMFSRNDFAGLCRGRSDLVPAATLTTATKKHIKLLWGDRAHENLMKSISPLGQLEITMENAHGGETLPAVRLPPRHGAGGHQARTVLGGRHHLERAAGARSCTARGRTPTAARCSAVHCDPLRRVSFLDTADGPEARQHHPKEPRAPRRRSSPACSARYSIKGEASVNLKASPRALCP
jgi:hypothetical protein